MSAGAYTEDRLVEQPAIGLFAELGWQTVSAMEEVFGPGGTLGRETSGEVVLVPRLRAALERLNPHFAAEAIASAVDELTRDRSAMSFAGANREICGLLKDGVKVRLTSFRAPIPRNSTRPSALRFSSTFMSRISVMERAFTQKPRR